MTRVHKPNKGTRVGNKRAHQSKQTFTKMGLAAPRQNTAMPAPANARCRGVSCPPALSCSFSHIITWMIWSDDTCLSPVGTALGDDGGGTCCCLCCRGSRSLATTVELGEGRGGCLPPCCGSFIVEEVLAVVVYGLGIADTALLQYSIADTL